MSCGAACTLLTLDALAQSGSERGRASAIVAQADSSVDADADLQRAVRRRLAADRYLVAADVEVAVESGIVLLGGLVPTWPSKERSARVARLVRDVRAVVNRIRVLPPRRKDAALASDVREALRGTAALVSMRIDVQVEGGIVQLTGTITSWEEQQLAERIAMSVPGARFCQNLLTRGSLARTGEVLVADVQTRLERDPLLQHAAIRVSVRGSRAFLTGTVGSAGARRRAMAHAWVQGISAVDAEGLRIDRSRHDPDLRSSWPAEGQILATIADLTPYWPSIDASKLNISLLGGAVTLRGEVRTLDERRAVGEMVRSAVGVVAVSDELRGPWWKPPAPTAPAPPPARRKRTRRG